MGIEEKKKLVKNLLKSAEDRIDNNTCGVSLDDIIEFMSPIVREKLNAEQVCNHYNISRATLTRWMSSDKIPKPHKDPGGKIYWFADELPSIV